MDHDVSLSLASVCSAALVVAKLLVRVYAASLLLLTLDTSKGASSKTRLLFTSPLIHCSLGCYRDVQLLREPQEAVERGSSLEEIGAP